MPAQRLSEQVGAMRFGKRAAKLQSKKPAPLASSCNSGAYDARRLPGVEILGGVDQKFADQEDGQHCSGREEQFAHDGTLGRRILAPPYQTSAGVALLRDA